MSKIRKIRKRCACGCKKITNYGKKWVKGHHRCGKKLSAETKEKISKALWGKKRSEETKERMSEAKKGHKCSTETKEKISKALQGKKLSEEHKKKLSKAKKGKKFSAEHKLNMSLAQIKYDPNYPYCEVWKDIGYRDDIRKDHCENIDCKKTCERLNNHHINLNKKDCHPNNIMTLCMSCHMALHNRLKKGKKFADPKDYIIINRPDHVSYIHKESREIIKIRRLTCQSIQ